MLIELGLLDLGFSSLFFISFPVFEWTLPYAPANSLGESCPNAMGIGAGGDLLTNVLLVESLIPFLIPSRFRIL